MKPPTLIGVVERRLLLNYRTDPELTARLLPAPLRPQLVNGWAVGGICMIRLGGLRPPGLPNLLGRRSENAAHRIAVEWDTPDGSATGVYIPRRDTESLTNTLIGGRLFPGEHHRAWFDVRESPHELEVGFTSADHAASVRVHARVTRELAGSALFKSLDEASAFFRRGDAGYSATRKGTCLDGLRLHTDRWDIEPLEVITASSSLFDDEQRFPAHTAILDSALLMRGVPVTWTPLPSMRVDGRRQAVRAAGVPGRASVVNT
jgi:hypothetical protein